MRFFEDSPWWGSESSEKTLAFAISPLLGIVRSGEEFLSAQAQGCAAVHCRHPRKRPKSEITSSQSSISKLQPGVADI